MIYKNVNEEVICQGNSISKKFRIGQVVFINDITEDKYGLLGEIVEIRTEDDRQRLSVDEIILNVFIADDIETATDILDSGEIIVYADIVKEI